MAKKKLVKKAGTPAVPKKPGIFSKTWDWAKGHKIITGIVLIIIAVVVGLSVMPGKDKTKYAYAAIVRGDVKQVVTATGEIWPINIIKVGSQVSGTISDIRVDYNDRVKKDDVLLIIDPSVLQATVDEAKATLDSATASLKLDRSEFNRAKSLFADGFIARSELDQAETKFKTSEQSVKRARSQYDRAMTNLGYATITSPVNGVVISRKVDKGQTVAASFQTPDLFEIAEDLSKMEIRTYISEADIGMVKNGQSVTFTVDAYPRKTFEGAIKQIRMSPSNAQNVVMYTVVIGVDNSDLSLLPGMTAFVTISIDSRTDVWKAPNSALLNRNIKEISQDPKVQSGEITGRDALVIERGGKQILVPYKRGLASASETEIITDTTLEKGDKIITGVLGAASKATGTVRQGGPGGGGPIGGGGGGNRR